MMVIRYTIEITLPDEGVDVNLVEAEVERGLSGAREGLWQSVVDGIEDNMMAHKGVAKQRKRPRSLLTMGGWVNFQRYVVKDSSGKYYGFADKVLGLLPRQRVCGSVMSMGCELSAAHSYRPAAGLLSAQTGGSISHMSLWRWVQQMGKALRKQSDMERELVFGQACEAERAAERRGLVVGEMDGTMIRLQRGAGNVEVKCGVMYSRKEKTGRRRRRVVDKAACAAIEPMDKFAERWWLMGEEKFRISEADNLLLITDGLDIYREAVSGYFPGVIHQLDRWHLNDRIHSVVQDAVVEKKLKQMLHEGRERDAIRFIRFHEFPGREEKAVELVKYLENNHDSINGVRRLPKDPATSSLRRVGSGVIEKTVGVLIADRFKGRGRCWSVDGANNLLAIRTDRYNNRYPLKGENINPRPHPLWVSLN